MNPLAVWEEARAVIIQAEGLHDALASGDYNFDISADACISIRDQQRSGKPPALPSTIWTLGSNTAACAVLLTEAYVKEALHGWQYDFPASTGANRTVCASGCGYTDIETALAAAACGDTVTISNETFAIGGATIDYSHHCPEASPIWIRGASWASWVAGVRTGLSDMSSMPQIQGGASNVSQLDIEPELISISVVNTGTDTLTTASAHGLSVGEQVTFTATAPLPISDTRPYWVLTVPTTTTFTVSKFENSGAATLDITGIAGGSLVLPTSWLRITGLSFNHTGTDLSGAIIDLTGVSGYYLPESRPHHIWVDHLVTKNNSTTVQLRRIINVTGRYFAATDSYLSGGQDDTDTQAILYGGDASGPGWAENNLFEVSGEGMMIGGTMGSNKHLNPGNSGLFVTKGNHSYKPMTWKWTSVVGAPTTPCVPGEWWKDTTGAPVYYTCAAGGASWTSDPGTNYPREDVAMKNAFEIKKTEGTLNIGNLYENSWPQGAAQQGGNLLSIKQSEPAQNGPNAETRNVLLYGEVGRNGGMMAKVAALSLNETTGRNGNIMFANMLFYNVDADLYDWNTDIAIVSAALTATSIEGPGGVTFRHITLMPKFEPTADERYFYTGSSAYTGTGVQGFSLQDSIFSVTDIKASGLTSGCLTLTTNNDPLAIGTNLFEYSDGAGPTMSSCSVAAYHETNLNAIGFAAWSGGTTPADFRLSTAGTTADYRAGGLEDAADGKDLGADTEIIADLTGGAETGFLGWSERYGVSITAMGTTTAAVEWDRPNAANACNLYLYTNYARTTEHADTDTVGERADNRAGNTVVAGHVTFNLGTAVLTTKTWYWFEIDCATDAVKMVGSLFTK